MSSAAEQGELRFVSRLQMRYVASCTALGSELSRLFVCSSPQTVLGTEMTMTMTQGASQGSRRIQK